ncbi:uncharacterized protein F4822DRAFT_424872 [Hypoxylon trugodes]|uniref:uncharacterized protein n=1 Tax=Hypoxylon trugodes TaxID=326681 RepID=UPI002193A7FE|nr:uncharacterized protein F4822DRAFT_424872 [Hypoxylon trugodes]KAI1394394.1 hypothetical protein F4822DRAFT_424872 [Hypoxylon trugodes]
MLLDLLKLHPTNRIRPTAGSNKSQRYLVTSRDYLDFIADLDVYYEGFIQYSDIYNICDVLIQNYHEARHVQDILLGAFDDMISECCNLTLRTLLDDPESPERKETVNQLVSLVRWSERRPNVKPSLFLRFFKHRSMLMPSLEDYLSICPYSDAVFGVLVSDLQSIPRFLKLSIQYLFERNPCPVLAPQTYAQLFSAYMACCDYAYASYCFRILRSTMRSPNLNIDANAESDFTKLLCLRPHREIQYADLLPTIQLRLNSTQPK